MSILKVIALLNEKGGSGKSTLSINIATALHRRGEKVVLIDADPQGTLVIGEKRHQRTQTYLPWLP